MKKIKSLFYSLLIFITTLNFSPTFCKYATYGYVGVAGNLIFSTLTFITETFVVYEEDFYDENGNLKDKVLDEPKWGTQSSAGEDFNLKSLHDVEFSVTNKSNVDLLVTFDIQFSMTISSGLGSEIEIVLTNLISNDQLTGVIPFNKTSSGGWLEIKSTYSGTVDPRKLSDSNGGNTTQIIERSFVIYSSASEGYTYSSYSLTFNFDSWLGTNNWLDKILGGSEYIYVKMSVIPYIK